MTSKLVNAFRKHQVKAHDKQLEPHFFDNLRECQVRWLQIAAPELGMNEISTLPAAVIEDLYSDILHLGPNAALVSKYLDRLTLLTDLDKRDDLQQKALDDFLSSPLVNNRVLIHKTLGRYSSASAFLSENLSEASDKASLAFKNYSPLGIGIARAGALIAGFHKAEEHARPIIKAYLPYLLNFVKEREKQR